MMTTHYQLLGVDPSASSAEIRRAYLALARRVHPDVGGTDADMRRLNEAWAVLADPIRRRRYDEVVQPSVDRAPEAEVVWAAEPVEVAGVAVPPTWDGLTLTLFLVCIVVALGCFVLGTMLQIAALLGFGVFVAFIAAALGIARVLLAMKAAVKPARR